MQRPVPDVGALHIAAPLTVEGGRPFAACGSYSFHVTDDWDAVTCGNCRRRRKAIERRAARLSREFDKLLAGRRSGP